MSFINYAAREINVKIVYYGPGLCGKTTNLQYIYEKSNPQQKGKLISLATETDRTLFFDFMPIELRQRSALLHGALERLPVSQREVVELHWFQERPYAEVAEIVGTSEGAVRVRAHRAYTTLKQLLFSEIRGDE